MDRDRHQGQSSNKQQTDLPSASICPSPSSYEHPLPHGDGISNVGKSVVMEGRRLWSSAGSTGWVQQWDSQLSTVSARPPSSDPTPGVQSVSLLEGMQL